MKRFQIPASSLPSCVPRNPNSHVSCGGLLSPLLGIVSNPPCLFPPHIGDPRASLSKPPSLPLPAPPPQSQLPPALSMRQVRPQRCQARGSPLPSRPSSLLSLDFALLLLLLTSCLFLLLPHPLFALLHLLPVGPCDKHPLPPPPSQQPLPFTPPPPPEVPKKEGGRTTLLQQFTHDLCP